MKKILIVGLFYVISWFLILAINSISPTNMAGLGLDIVVYFLSALFSIAFLANSLLKLRSQSKITYLNLFINIIGLFIMACLLYWEFTKPT